MHTINVNVPKLDADQLLLESLENAWRKYLTELKRCREEFSNEAVHDLRVATRRMMAVIQLLNSISPRPRLQKIIRTLKEQLDDLDDLRDIQVIVAELSESVQELPELHEFEKRQQRIEDRLLRTLRKKIKKFSVHELSKRIRKTHDSIQTEHDLEAQTLQAADDAYMLTRQRLGLVDLARPVTIHRVRIAFKDFRYTVEIIHPLLKDFPEANLKWMHDYQSLMGEVQDSEVFIQTLTDFSERVTFLDPEPIHRYCDRRHAEAIAAFAEDMNQLQSFWRSAPNQPFPWEKPE
jgi:CHAD domain-containing protein